MKNLIVFLFFLNLISCSKSISEPLNCEEIDFYPFVTLKFDNCQEFSHFSKDSIEVYLEDTLNCENSMKRVEVIHDSSDSAKLIHFIYLECRMNSSSKIYMNVQNNEFVFDKFNFGNAKIETFFNDFSYHCILRGANINNVYKSQFFLKVYKQK